MRNKSVELSFAVIAMIIIVAASNYLVEIPINNWLTWGAFTYPFTFLVTELTNYHYGPKNARQVVYAGFAVAVLFSFMLMNPQIALASSIAFLVGQLLDVSVFNRLRQKRWWIAPAAASALAGVVDTAIFFSIAFFGGDWIALAFGDLAIKLSMDLMLLVPFRMMLWQRPKIA